MKLAGFSTYGTCLTSVSGNNNRLTGCEIPTLTQRGGTYRDVDNVTVRVEEHSTGRSRLFLEWASSDATCNHCWRMKMYVQYHNLIGGFSVLYVVK